MNTRTRTRKEAGLCPQCGRSKGDSPYANCVPCYGKIKRNAEARASKRREAGRCVSCGQPSSSKWCEVCHAKKREASRNNNLVRNFGITLDEYNHKLRGQGGVCEICRRLPPATRNLAVDHNHSTGEVRGLLCTQCNILVGYLERNIAKGGIEYLIRYNTNIWTPRKGLKEKAMAIKIKTEGKAVSSTRYQFLATICAAKIGEMANYADMLPLEDGSAEDPNFDEEVCEILAHIESAAKDVVARLAEFQQVLRHRVKPAPNAKPVDPEDLEDAEDEE